MSQFHSLRPIPGEEADLSRERYSQKLQVIPPTGLPSETEMVRPTTETFAAISLDKHTEPIQPLQAVSYKTVTIPLQAVAQPPSLISALEGTMQSKAVRPAVVIPGSRQRPERTRGAAQNGSRLRGAVRHGLVTALTLGAVCMTLFLFFSPLGNGQNEMPMVGGAVRWVASQQSALSFISRPQIQAPATTAPAPVAPVAPASLPKSQYIAIAQQAAVAAGIPPDAFVRQINQESGFNPYAVSPAGAVGIAQFLPSTAAGLGINPYDPVSALYGAARYMASLAAQFGGDYAKGLAAYNAGPGNVQRAINLGGANWLAFMPLETQNYVRIIMG
ncbi:lytic transglycosylase domain-containing protein [Tengunoibacter tsumagoiensis]|uniref:Transglycosylase SLT domain-containing protein n=1 Tax=Tengunoibacter tsumagoiensis TaxID=2014871 RepID=A0A401ZTI6_9CHLR|nr:lytic transglycosylase domain-containing protein [Tengunoibacter tsumagoiensis]GCE10183.1 hypothetical protein KTT_00420 [Tengunoibacter tsumagoiensis]